MSFSMKEMLEVAAESGRMQQEARERAEVAEAKVALALERLHALLNHDASIGSLWRQDRDAILGVVLVLESGG